VNERALGGGKTLRARVPSMIGARGNADVDATAN
jgi:hypothetical protein